MSVRTRFIKAQNTATDPTDTKADDPYNSSGKQTKQSESDTVLKGSDAPPAPSTDGRAPTVGASPTTGGAPKSPPVAWSDAGDAPFQGQGPLLGITTIRRPGKPTVTRTVTPRSMVDPKAVDRNPVVVIETKPITATADQYEAEYWEKVLQDPVKKKWLADRALVNGWVTTYDPKSPFGVSEDEFVRGGIHDMWTQAGAIVRMNPTLNTQTPEDYLDALYQRHGGDDALAALQQSENPIKTTKQINTYNLSQEQANVIADTVATQVLGHMASDADMKRARKAMNSLMARNPTVTTTTSDNTDPNNQVVTSHTAAGVSPDTAQAAYEMKLRRSSEGMAFGVGKLMESAMAKLDQGL